MQGGGEQELKVQDVGDHQPGRDTAAVADLEAGPEDVAEAAVLVVVVAEAGGEQDHRLFRNGALPRQIPRTMFPLRDKRDFMSIPTTSRARTILNYSLVKTF